MRLLDGETLVASHDIGSWDGSRDAIDLGAIDAQDADALGFRVVHGGADFRGPVQIGTRILAQLEALTSLAPLHQPRSLAAIAAVRAAAPDLPAVACFDTAFHAMLPPAAATYALPREWLRRWDLRRFGFHGLSHQNAARRTVELVGPAARIVSCHLGAGASLCAIRDGRSVDTTMGFTPLEGLVMATRSGSVDPGLVGWLTTEAGLPAHEVAQALESSAGLAGLSGTSGDMREVLDAVTAGEGAARLAFDVYIHRLRREIGAMVASLGGLDALVFTGGVGEHVPVVRSAAARPLAFLGISVDGPKNGATRADGDITAAGATVKTVVVTAREDVEIARQVHRTLA